MTPQENLTLGDAEEAQADLGARKAEIDTGAFGQWGAHYIKSAVMGGEVEIKTMISRDR